MSAKQQSLLKFLGVEFPMVNFNSDKRLSPDLEIDIDVVPKVFYPKEDPKIFQIVQEITVSTKDYFRLSLVAIGTFEVSTEIDQEIKNSFVQLNAPAIMFPYLRAFITTFTANIGPVTGTLTIPPQFFKGSIEEITDEDMKKATR